MGPTHRQFQRVKRHHEPRVYLSRAEAAILSTQPAFRRASEASNPAPGVDVEALQYAADPRNRTLVVSGRVRAVRRVAYALVADEAAGRPGEYWTKTYVGKVDPDGRFQVVVTEPWESSGTLKTGLVFENGGQTVHPRGSGREGGIIGPYRYGQGKWTFE